MYCMMKIIGWGGIPFFYLNENNSSVKTLRIECDLTSHGPENVFFFRAVATVMDDINGINRIQSAAVSGYYGNTNSKHLNSTGSHFLLIALPSKNCQTFSVSSFFSVRICCLSLSFPTVKEFPGFRLCWAKEAVWRRHFGLSEVVMRYLTLYRWKQLIE